MLAKQGKIGPKQNRNPTAIGKITNQILYLCFRCLELQFQRFRRLYPSSFAAYNTYISFLGGFHFLYSDLFWQMSLGYGISSIYGNPGFTLLFRVSSFMQEPSRACLQGLRHFHLLSGVI